MHTVGIPMACSVPTSFPPTALAFHNAQLEASAFREEFDPENFEDLTLPKYDAIHKVRFPRGILMPWLI